jgi:hypothetical protein
MNITSLPALLSVYGIFLICCGIASVLLIGGKAKTALISGGTSGAIALFIAWLVAKDVYASESAGILLSLGLFIVFCWRSAKTLFKVFELIPAASPDLKGKGIAFLIISLMAVMSLFVTVLQIIMAYPVFREAAK